MFVDKLYYTISLSKMNKIRKNPLAPQQRMTIFQECRLLDHVITEVYPTIKSRKCKDRVYRMSITQNNVDFYDSFRFSPGRQSERKPKNTQKSKIIPQISHISFHLSDKKKEARRKYLEQKKELRRILNDRNEQANPAIIEEFKMHGRRIPKKKIAKEREMAYWCGETLKANEETITGDQSVKIDWLTEICNSKILNSKRKNAENILDEDSSTIRIKAPYKIKKHQKELKQACTELSSLSFQQSDMSVLENAKIPSLNEKQQQLLRFLRLGYDHEVAMLIKDPELAVTTDEKGNNIFHLSVKNPRTISVLLDALLPQIACRLFQQPNKLQRTPLKKAAMLGLTQAHQLMLDYLAAKL